MYSPPIRDDLIPRIYRAAKEDGVPMTKWVSDLIEAELDRRDAQVPRQAEPDRSEAGVP